MTGVTTGSLLRALFVLPFVTLSAGVPAPRVCFKLYNMGTYCRNEPFFEGRTYNALDRLSTMHVPIETYDNHPVVAGFQTGNNWAAHLEGRLDVTESGYYHFAVRLGSGDGAWLFVDGTRIAFCSCSLYCTGYKYLATGSHEVVTKYVDDGHYDRLSVEYRGPDTNGTQMQVPQHRWLEMFCGPTSETATTTTTTETDATAHRLHCPEQTVQVNRVVQGCGMQSCQEAGRFAMLSAEACHERCQTHAVCWAFTWAPVGGDRSFPDSTVCTLHNMSQADRTSEPSQIMCKLPSRSPQRCSRISKEQKDRFKARNCSSHGPDENIVMDLDRK